MPKTGDQVLLDSHDEAADCLRVKSVSGGTGTIPTATPLRKSGTQDLSAGPLSMTTSFAQKHKVKAVILHAGAAITQTVKVTLDSKTGANYDTLLDSAALVANTDYVWIPDGELLLDSGDELLVTCTNAGAPAITVYAEVLTEAVA